MAKNIWRVWAKALGEKAGSNDTEADAIALVRTIIVMVYILTNFVIVAGVVRHWNDSKMTKLSQPHAPRL